MNGLPRRLYLAGPMVGYPEHNSPLFNRVAGVLRDRGHAVFNPAENDDGGVRRDRAFYMRKDVPEVIAAEGLVLLSGWQESRGASLEVWLAIDLGIPLFACVIDGDEVLVELLPPPELSRLPFV